MAISLIAVGLLLFVASVRNTQDQLWTLVKGDFTGSGSFVYWAAAILAVGLIGVVVPPLKDFSTAMLVLVVLVLFLSKKGFVTQLESSLNLPNTGKGA